MRKDLTINDKEIITVIIIMTEIIISYNMWLSSFNFLPSLSNQNALKSNYSSTNKNIDDLTILKKVQIYGIDTLSRVQ